MDDVVIHQTEAEIQQRRDRDTENEQRNEEELSEISRDRRGLPCEGLSRDGRLRLNDISRKPDREAGEGTERQGDDNEPFSLLGLSRLFNPEGNEKRNECDKYPEALEDQRDERRQLAKHRLTPSFP